jgi:NADP-dependent 3-hydroxy acid dehydrogenase YdfG
MRRGLTASAYTWARRRSQETGKLFAAEGAKVCLAARREPELQKAVADIEAAGGEAMYTTTDVTEPAAIKEMVAACVAKFGKLDILFVSDLAASRCSSCTDTRGSECTNALDVSYACLIG